MYRYDEFDDAFVRDRVQRFRSQIERRIAAIGNDRVIHGGVSSLSGKLCA